MSLSGRDRPLNEPNPPLSRVFIANNLAIVSDAINPGQLGRVYHQATYWFGCALDDVYIPKGSIIELVERQGNTWLVKPIAGQ
ncbi:MAG: hypothetical protein F6K30_14740 [Cyanothece sp. SIO2G6]|nr:hypothetical protein [Cyanothece sp. SIO2G6]